MFYVITDNKVYSSSNLDKLNRKNHLKFDFNDFRAHGNDYVVCLSTKDIEFVQDCSKLSNIAMSKLFKADTLPKILLYVLIVMTFITMVKK